MKVWTCTSAAPTCDAPAARPGRKIAQEVEAMSEQEKCGSCGDLEAECVCDDGQRRRFELPPKIDLRSAGEVARGVARSAFGVELPEGAEVLLWTSATPFTAVGVRAVGGAGQIEVRVRYPREVLRRASLVTRRTAPERVTDDELELIDRIGARAALVMLEGGSLAVRDEARRAISLLPRLAASERARRDDAAIGRILDEAGITACEGETLRGRVERLAKRDANLQRWVTVMREARDGVVDDTETAEIRLRHCADAARLEHGGVPLQEHEDRGYLLMVLNEARAARDEQRARAEKAEAEVERLKGAVEDMDNAGEQLCETVDREPVTRLEKKLKGALDGVTEALGAPAGLPVEALPAFARGRLSEPDPKLGSTEDRSSVTPGFEATASKALALLLDASARIVVGVEKLAARGSPEAFEPTPEEVAGCASLALFAGRPVREAVAHLASRVGQLERDLLAEQGRRNAESRRLAMGEP